MAEEVKTGMSFAMMGGIAAAVLIVVIIIIVFMMRKKKSDTGTAPGTLGGDCPCGEGMTCKDGKCYESCVARNNCAVGEAPHNADFTCNYNACVPGIGENMQNITICGGSPTGSKSHLYGWQDNPCKYTGDSMTCAEFKNCYQAYGKTPCGGTTEYANCAWGGDLATTAKAPSTEHAWNPNLPNMVWNPNAPRLTYKSPMTLVDRSTSVASQGM